MRSTLTTKQQASSMWSMSRVEILFRFHTASVQTCVYTAWRCRLPGLQSFAFLVSQSYAKASAEHGKHCGLALHVVPLQPLMSSLGNIVARDT